MHRLRGTMLLVAVIFALPIAVLAILARRRRSRLKAT
jgi:hypothetical protein